MTEGLERPRIGTFARIAAGSLGAFILGSGFVMAWLTIRDGEAFWAILPLAVCGAASAVFLHSAYVGTSPRWEDLPD